MKLRLAGRLSLIRNLPGRLLFTLTVIGLTLLAIILVITVQGGIKGLLNIFQVESLFPYPRNAPPASNYILGFETTMAFMLEAGFLGVLLFGWGRYPEPDYGA